MSCCRHWKALTRKNCINWRRRPKCSFFEILCPVLTMFVMIFMRHYIHTSTVPYQKLIPELKMPVIPGLAWDGSATKKAPNGAWSTSIIKQRKTQKTLNDFFNYGEYAARPGSTDYSLEEDVRGPFYFVPSDCLKVKSFQLPLVEMPIIAVVGEWNQATYMMQNYLEELISWQKSDIIGSKVVNKLLTTEYGKNATYPDFQFMNFTSRDELFDYTSAENYTFPGGNLGVCYGFQIEQDADTEEWNLELYFNDQSTLGGTSSTGIPDTQVPAYNPLQTTPDVGDYEKYLRRGYATLHNLAANVILKITTGLDSAGVSLLVKPMPAETNVSDSFKQVWSKIFPFLIILTFIPPVYNMVSLLVREKETRIKESMRMMGMSDVAYWLSWYFYYTIISTVIVLLAWGVLMYNCIVYSNPFLVLCFLLLYAQSVLGQIVFLTSLFEKSKYSGIIGSLVYFGFSLVGIPVQEADASVAYKTGLSIFPQVAMQQICFVMGNLEGAGVGLNYENANESINNFSYTRGLAMLALSMVVFLLIGFYLSAVLPRSVGERQHPCFCFTFCCRKRHADVEQEVFSEAAHKMMANDPFELKYLDKNSYEAVPLEVARLELEDDYMRIEDLTKVYPNGFEAVSGINLKMYSGQIFALLGQNGAGKSTMISMLTGLIGRTAGRARLFGQDLFRDMQKARQAMGVCPQHDVLFDLLTPAEHLDIFYDFKGGDPGLKRQELKSLITDVGITLDKNRLTHTLSGGNKRKLSVAIALCGNSKLVMLDEPTAGMDLQARRSLWDMLKNYRSNRIIVLTTHYMDEADVLGDRIAIMAKGGIQCLGSSLFLKNHYGAGYKLTMVKSEKKVNKVIKPFLEQRLGAVEKLSEVSQEITFKISYEQAAQFQSFFEEFDNCMHEVGVLSYGISMTTLEEVFLQVNGSMQSGKEQHKLLQPQQDDDDSEEFSIEGEQSQNLIGQSSCCKSVGALMKKRFSIYKRDWCGLMCELVIPVFLVLIGLAFCEVGWLSSSSVFTLETSAFPSPQRMLFNQENVKKSLKEFTPQEIAQNLPNYSDGFWQITYDDTQDITYKEYYDEVTAQQNVGEPEPYRFGSFQIYQANKETMEFQINMFLNSTSSQAVPYFSQFIYQSILKTMQPDLKFNTKTAPFPTFYVFETRAQSTQAIDFAVIISVALALIPCVTIALIIYERENKLKHMQMVSGVSLPAYWVSNLISDILKMYIPIAIIIGMNAAFDLHYEGVWQLLVLYPISIVPFTYLTSFLFTRDTTGQILSIFIHFMAGGILPNVIYFMQNIPWTADLGDKMRWWFVFIPSFCVGQGITFSSTYQELNLARTGLISAGFDVNPINTHVYAWENLSANYAIMLAIAVVCLLALWVIESGLFRSCSNFSVRFRPAPERGFELDEDVVEEEERLALQTQSQSAGDESQARLLDQENQRTRDPTSKDFISVQSFQKYYSTLFSLPYLAVERVSFGLNVGECFALLGVNGAGKSTVFKSLTGEVVPTAGQIQIQGIDAVKDFGKVRRLIGYCPQYDAIFPLMTVDEHLELYAKVKNIPVEMRSQVIEESIEKLQLREQRSKLACNLSGGNKRKLSVAVALLGNPQIILLDEPSSGMDPEARRFMWSVIEKISTRDKRSTVILTTHSMEEAEALSTKMGIMARGGVFRCFGSSQHIKNKFATGYEIELKIKKTSNAELLSFKSQLGVQGDMATRVDLEQQVAALKQSRKVESLILDQIKQDGLGSDLLMDAQQNNGEIKIQSLVSYCYVQTYGMRFISKLAKIFERVDLLEHCGDHLKLRVAREDKTIGFLFGLIEQQKSDLKIQEYGVSQTSLEQIFQDFANQSVENRAAYSFQLDNLGQLQLLNPMREQLQLSDVSDTMQRKPSTDVQDNIKSSLI